MTLPKRTALPSTMRTLMKAILSSVIQVFKSSHYTATIYLDTLRFLNDLGQEVAIVIRPIKPVGRGHITVVSAAI